MARTAGATNGEANSTHITKAATKERSVLNLAPEGSLTSFKPLYQGPKDSNKEWTWLDTEPKDAVDAAENEETAQHALVIRNKKSPDSRKKYEIHSLIVQSQWLKDALEEILNGYPGICCQLQRLVFEAPFEPFVHRWPQLLEYKQRDLDAKTAEHIELLHTVLKEELKDVIRAWEDYVAHGVITYEYLWTIFQPGSTVFSESHKGAPAVFHLEKGQYVQTQCGKGYRLTVKAVDWNGTQFGHCQDHITLWEFLGTAKITALQAFPMSSLPNREAFEELCIERGKKFEALAGCHYKEYNGIAITWDYEGKEMPITVSGRIVVDSDSFRRNLPRRVNYIEPLRAKDGAPEPSEPTAPNTEEDKYAFGKEELKNRIRLTEKHQLMCTARVRGYSLKMKKWLLFYVDVIKDIKYNDEAFKSLVLPEDQKELILSFAESQTLNRSAFDDVISGKGRGIIMLLSGPPGVGKTLTAESVSENMHVPLYMMSAGDLGIDPNQVESKLTNVLEMIAKWNAVLLLDECDVFLEARSTHDLERNKLVSIFLRLLEYYEGILFLTTNRIDNIDAAFQSRIHVSMAYPDLTNESRRHIWENFLKLMDKHEFSAKDLDELAMVELNGRQIKNVLKTSQLLAARKKVPLRREFVDTVLAIESRRPGAQGV